jgi:hypothetical protein
LAVSSMWVVSPGDPAAKAALLANAASANAADPDRKRPLRSSSIMMLILQICPARSKQRPI